jgi:hypothetical protein
MGGSGIHTGGKVKICESIFSDVETSQINGTRKVIPLARSRT